MPENIEMYDFLDISLIIGEPEKNDSDGMNFILKNDTKLSSVFNFLPWGRINKTETGIGATTLELNSKRHSIIVQPLRITAEEKANSQTIETKKDILFFGKIKDKVNTTSVAQKLIDYLNNDTIPYKKLSVVADSLPVLIEKLKLHYKDTDLNVFQDYFLLIDEIDSFQLDSTFRSKMEICIDYYKKFNNNKRALISATLFDFSDPLLTKEPLTKIKYENPHNINLNAIYSPKPIQSGFNFIKSSLEELPNNEKIVVAINSTSECYSLAQLIENETKLEKKDISLLFGDSNQENKKKMEEFSGCKISQKKLPSKLIFKTSAYYSGFDIEEKYHLIVIIDVNAKNTILNPSQIMQIAGRCRVGLKSFNLFYNFQSKPSDEQSSESLIESAKAKIIALDCIQSNFTTTILQESRIKTRDAIINVRDYNEQSFVRTNHFNVEEVIISYLNIDACIIMQENKRNNYSESGQLVNSLRNLGYIVTKAKDYPTETLSASNKINKEKEIDDIISKLTNKIITNKQYSGYSSLSKNSKLLIDIYEVAITLFSHNSIINVITKQKKQSQTKLKNILEYLREVGDTKKSKVYKHIKDKFPINKTQKRDEILANLAEMFEDLTLSLKIDIKKSPEKGLEWLTKFINIKPNPLNKYNYESEFTFSTPQKKYLFERKR